jgi:hypothetical protein
VPEMRMRLETVFDTWLMIRHGRYLLKMGVSHGDLPDLG